MGYSDFLKNNVFFHMNDSKTPLELSIAVAENLKNINQLIHIKFENFDDLINAYLRVGIDIFDLETGIISNIEGGDTYVVKDVISPIKEIKKGDRYPLGDTYCSEVFKNNKIICFSEVGLDEVMKSHPTYKNLKLESYISAPIYVNEKLYGTLNFSSTKPREFGFSENERDLIGIMADAIGNYISRDQNDQMLHRAKDDLSKVRFLLENVLESLKSLSKNSDSEQVASIRNNVQKSIEIISL